MSTIRGDSFWPFVAKRPQRCFDKILHLIPNQKLLFAFMLLPLQPSHFYPDLVKNGLELIFSLETLSHHFGEDACIKYNVGLVTGYLLTEASDLTHHQFNVTIGMDLNEGGLRHVHYTSPMNELKKIYTSRWL